MNVDPHDCPHGYDVYTHTEVIPKQPPKVLHWRIGPVQTKTFATTPAAPPSPPPTGSDITMQLTADQQVELTITGEDRYGNPVDISGETVWRSSDESIVQIARPDHDSATAFAVGPTGTAAVTVSNDVNNDGTGDFMGSIAIDVVSGEIAEIEVTAGEATSKPEANQDLPGNQPLPGQELPDAQPLPGQELPGDQPLPDQSLPGDQPKPDQGLPNTPNQDLPRRRP